MAAEMEEEREVEIWMVLVVVVMVASATMAAMVSVVRMHHISPRPPMPAPLPFQEATTATPDQGRFPRVQRGRQFPLGEEVAALLMVLGQLAQDLVFLPRNLTRAQERVRDAPHHFLERERSARACRRVTHSPRRKPKGF
jgi:hypothetical protein